MTPKTMPREIRSILTKLAKRSYLADDPAEIQKEIDKAALKLEAIANHQRTIGWNNCMRDFYRQGL